MPPIATSGNVSNRLPDGSQALESKHRRGVAFRRGREDRTDREVVDREFRRRDRLFDVVRRITDHGVRPQKLSRRFGWHVVLAQMNTVRANRESDIDTIVDDQLHARCAATATAAFACS